MANSTAEHPSSIPVGTLSESLEDYLEIILLLQQEKRIARVRDIAQRKGVSNASVSNALARLARDGYVRHEAHEFVELTERGTELAQRVLRRHEFLMSFLRDVLQVSPEVAETDACAIEHHVSPETLERLAAFYQFVRSCPQMGTQILQAFSACCASDESALSSAPRTPSCGRVALTQASATPCPGQVERESLVSLRSLQPGDCGVVVRLAAPVEMRKHLADAGLLPNVRVEMGRAGGESDSIQVSVQGHEMQMNAEEATAVMVRRV